MTHRQIVSSAGSRMGINEHAALLSVICKAAGFLATATFVLHRLELTHSGAPRMQSLGTKAVLGPRCET